MNQVELNGNNLTLEEVEAVATSGVKVKIAPEAINKINKCRKV
jgi:histidine ammonia-lyase